MYLRNLSSRAVANLIEYATPDVHLCAEYACTAAPTSVEVSLEHLCAPTLVRLVGPPGRVGTYKCLNWQITAATTTTTL